MEAPVPNRVKISVLFPRYVIFSLLLLPTHTLSAGAASSSSGHCRAWIVQSIPTDMPHLSHVPGILSTGDVFRWLAGNSSRSLDIIAQYWQLLAAPGDPRSGDYGYSESNMQKFKAQEGFHVYNAIRNAADHNVTVRLLQHSGVYPDYTKEPSDLASGRTNVKSVTLLLDEWWGSGVVHAKVWISDKRDIYIGSANNDWKSLTQVKEVGIYLVNCPRVAKAVEVYYDSLWKLASLNVSDYTTTVWDQQWQIKRKVPCWSHFVNYDTQCRSPLPRYINTPHIAGYPELSDPNMFYIPIETPGYSYSTLQPQPSYLSFAPPELSFGKHCTDEQAWIDTIKSVGSGATVRISTMDWLGQSEYMNEVVYWPSLSSAISQVIYSRHANVKILVAYWAHFINNTDEYLKSLLYSNILCASSVYNNCSGKVEIKYYKVPGFNLTGPASQNGTTTGNIYPSYTRVNHGKYAVSDVRAHIGTSNLLWDYFYTTASVSFGTYNPAIVAQLQEVFDADWNSPYAVPVEPLQEVHHQSSCKQ